MKRIALAQHADLHAMVAGWLAKAILYRYTSSEVVFLSRRRLAQVARNYDFIIDGGKFETKAKLRIKTGKPLVRHILSTQVGRIWWQLLNTGYPVGHLIDQMDDLCSVDGGNGHRPASYLKSSSNADELRALYESMTLSGG